MVLQGLSCVLGFVLLAHAVAQPVETKVCIGSTTLDDGSTVQIPCPLVFAQEKWVVLPENLTKAYPDCCSQVVPPLDIVPDVLDQMSWSEKLEITYEGGLKVDYGNELTPTQVQNKPEVSFQAEPHAHYLLAMTDPDAPSRAEPSFREFHHWLVGNIPCGNVSRGDVLTEYIGSGAPLGTGLHRYTFVLYKQPGKINFDEAHINITQGEERKYFNIRKFAAKYNLGNPVAINIFQAQYDDYVPKLLAQVGITV